MKNKFINSRTLIGMVLSIILLALIFAILINRNEMDHFNNSIIDNNNNNNDLDSGNIESELNDDNITDENNSNSEQDTNHLDNDIVEENNNISSTNSNNNDNNDDTDGSSNTDSTDNNDSITTNNSNNSSDNSSDNNNDNDTSDNALDNNDNSTEENSYATLNKEIADEIIDLYKISVLYDSKAYYSEGGVSATKTTESDGESLYNTLVAFKGALANIPQSILDTLRLERGFHIHVLKEMPGGQNGLAVFSPMHSQKIVIDVDNRYQDRMLYHEIFHIMDRYMYWQNGQKDAFVNWNSYNPVGFTYSKYDPSNKYTIGSLTYKYTYSDSTVTNSEKSFVTKYSKTDELEDRAELFEDLMVRTRKYYYMEDGYAINEKAKYLDEIIDKYFGNINNAHWERWITY